MAQALPPIPYKQPLTDVNSGSMSDIWSKWFRDMYQRIGGALSSTNEELSDQMATLQTTVSSLQTTVNSHTTILDGISNGLTVGPTL
jgi:hypothetical protein